MKELIYFNGLKIISLLQFYSKYPRQRVKQAQLPQRQLKKQTLDYLQIKLLIASLEHKD